MSVFLISSVARGAANVAANSAIGYGVCKMMKDESAKDIAIILAIDTTCRIATERLFEHVFGERVKHPGNMVHCAWLLTTGVIQLTSTYLANKLFKTKSPNRITLFGYIAFSWKVNMMLKDIWSLRR